MVVFLSDQASQLCKAQGLNLTEKRETNIEKLLEGGWVKLIDSTVFLKKNGE